MVPVSGRHPKGCTPLHVPAQPPRAGRKRSRSKVGRLAEEHGEDGLCTDTAMVCEAHGLRVHLRGVLEEHPDLGPFCYDPECHAQAEEQLQQLESTHGRVVHVDALPVQVDQPTVTTPAGEGSMQRMSPDLSR